MLPPVIGERAPNRYGGVASPVGGEIGRGPQHMNSLQKGMDLYRELPAPTTTPSAQAPKAKRMGVAAAAGRERTAGQRRNQLRRSAATAERLDMAGEPTKTSDVTGYADVPALAEELGGAGPASTSVKRRGCKAMPKSGLGKTRTAGRVVAELGGSSGGGVKVGVPKKTPRATAGIPC
jgi:hypothetical protein